ncbi:hypothetical protein Cgig2_025454 [Carnegiea gigantea]|uniref:Uncharacterized protein n=1 Tax=Carnegiea gigantea TaxID=171969 RepID=A0A9Q1GQA9_9CARY|nr:hypothetical protein Cgig2_025454 [Carnegiea gigantea]
MVFSYFLNTEQAVNHVRVTFMWHWREQIRPPHSLPEGYHGLRPNFDLDVAEASTRDFCIPELTMSLSCSSGGKIPERSADRQTEGCHPQFPSLPALIDGRLVAYIPPKNQFRELKKIPYVVPLYEPGTPSWFSCEYSSTPSVLSIEQDIIYLWKIDVAVDYMHDF